ncbi:uncharacterized protein LOC101893468 [Musca domestica]|uniref:Uncharacterized protein LOC101893468 n=1 Tax=Musca domestica TaxID=7370 RepID=A0A9J7CLP4_MUSDO|nr:uncharacterized protein LOC101893468 [Musca domestica]
MECGRLSIILLVLIQGAVTGWALHCHICRNSNNALCYKIKMAENPTFLKECWLGATMCVTELTRGEVPKVERKCAARDWFCESECFNCTSDGCNYHNDVQMYTTVTHNLDVSPMELLMGNIYKIGALCLVVVILIIWCISRYCSKKSDDDMDFEYGEGEEDEEYDEDNVDEDDEDCDDDEEEEDDDSDCYDADSIENEYKEYAKEAEADYENIKTKKSKKLMEARSVPVPDKNPKNVTADVEVVVV